MKRYIYNRVSSLAQDYDQQQHCIKEYFARTGINPDSIDEIVVETISGTVNHTERKLAALIDRAEEGDTIFISELSRLGRNMSDLFAIVTECSDKGVRIVQCKDGSQIENTSIGGKALLFALGLAAEIEVQNIRQRTRMGLDVRKELLAKHGKFISKSGRECTHLGRPKGCDMSIAIDAAIKLKQDRAIAWRENSKGYKMARRWYFNGWSRNDIINEFNAMHEIDPANWSTSGGAELSKGVLSKWVSEWGEFVIATNKL